MDYSQNDIDAFLKDKFQGDEGANLNHNLSMKIEELELQLKLLKEQLCFCDSQIDIYQSKVKMENSAIKKEYYNEMIQIFRDHKLILNICTSITLLSAEIKSNQRNLYFDDTEWGKRNAGKQICTTLYEACSDVFVLLGKDFKEMTSSRINITHVNDEINGIRKRLVQYRSDNINYFCEVRNNIAAHKDMDSLTQIRIIENINWSNLIEKTMEFEKIINDLGAFMKKVMDLNFVNLANSPKGKGLI